MRRSIWVGFDHREQDAFQVCVDSIRAHLSEDIEIFALSLPVMQRRGLYQRPTERRDGRLWDVISGAPMSTEFAITRFLTPFLAQTGHALFMDCDMLVRADLVELFEMADPRKAIQVVKHAHKPKKKTKMDGQVQTAYPRKNWSSVMLWDVAHAANCALTVQKVNTWAGRALHRFGWLEDQFIGDLPPCWNHLVGVDRPDADARIVHFTLGTPDMPGYEDCEFADEWRAMCRPGRGEPCQAAG